MKSNIYIAILLTALSFSCNNQNHKDALLPSVTGKAGEVILVMEESYWEGKSGEIWKEICHKSVVGLPQAEHMFDLIQIPKDAFTNIFKSHRNIILMDLNPAYDTAKINLQKNIWSRPQIVMTLSAPNKESYNNLLVENKQKISDILLGVERKRILSNYNKYEEKQIGKHLEEKYGLSMVIPKGYTLDVDTANFVWISHETPLISQGVLIYFYDYIDTLQFEKESLINKRNEILESFVPGSLPTSYMTTETEIPVNYEQFYLNDRYFAQLKGLWRVENDFMGGPFHSLSTVDEKRNKIVCVEGYLYSPKYDKRNYMRQLEAILFTLEII